MLLLTLFSIVVSWLGLKIWRNRKITALASKISSDRWVFPIVGHTHLFLGGGEVRMKVFQSFGKHAIKIGGLSSIWIGDRLMVVVADPKVAEIVLKACLDKDEILDVVHDLIGHGSIFAPVSVWRHRRKIIAPIFSMKNLNNFVKIFAEQSNIMAEQLKRAAGKGAFSIWKYVNTYSMDSACQSTLGVKLDVQRSPKHPFLDAFEKHCHMGAERMLLPPILLKAYPYMPIYKRYMKHVYSLQGFIDMIIKNKRDEIKEKHENSVPGEIDAKDCQQKTFLDMNIESPEGDKRLTNLELREECMVQVLAATDTSAVGVAFTCLMLARNPDAQKKVYEELRDVFGDSDRVLTAKDLPHLKYLDAVIKESLRLYPPVPIILRRVVKDCQLPSGLTLMKGISLMINIWAIHRNPQYWGEDVEQFRPERFFDSPPKHPAAFIPFSHGPRSCLGYQYAMMSMKTAVATLLRRYHILPATPVDENSRHAPLRVKFDVMMKHVGNFEVQLDPRMS